MKFILVILLLTTLVFTVKTLAEVQIKNDVYEQKARKALESIVKEQVGKIQKTANSTGSSHENNIKGYVLSSHIRKFSDIPKNINSEIIQLREQVQLLIRRVAIDIEITGGSSGALSLGDNGEIIYKPTQGLPKSLNEKRKQLLNAHLQNSVSVRSAAMAIQILSMINEELKAEAGKAHTRQQQERIYMMQAIFVYEMSDITLEFLESLALEGKETINELYQDAQKRVNNRLSDIDGQIAKAEQLKSKGLLSDTQVEEEKDTYNLMRKANEQSLEAWKDLISMVDKQQDFLNNLKDKASLIAYKRDKAKVQIETLRDLRQVAELKDTIGSLDDIVDSVASLDLLILDESTVRNLLGYEIDR